LAFIVEAAGGSSKAQERIALVRIEDVKQSRLPEVLQNCRAYDFFKVHPSRKVTLTYGLPRLDGARNVVIFHQTENGVRETFRLYDPSAFLIQSTFHEERRVQGVPAIEERCPGADG
jgi:hypothetical protein